MTAPSSRITHALLEIYATELETISQYLAASVNLKGVFAEPVGDSLRGLMSDELDHAIAIAKRLAELGVPVPISPVGVPRHAPPVRHLEKSDAGAIIEGVIEIEDRAVSRVRKLIESCGSGDTETTALGRNLLEDAEHHREKFLAYRDELAREQSDTKGGDANGEEEEEEADEDLTFAND